MFRRFIILELKLLRNCHFVLLKEVVQIDEKVVITKDNKRMVLPNLYFDEVTNGSCIISTAAHNIITDHLQELQRTVQ